MVEAGSPWVSAGGNGKEHKKLTHTSLCLLVRGAGEHSHVPGVKERVDFDPNQQPIPH